MSVARVLKRLTFSREVEACAETCLPAGDDVSAAKASSDNDHIPAPASSHLQTHTQRFNSALDWLVRLSGSTIMFVVVQLILLVWALLGIPYWRVVIWPIIISDAQAIFCYLFDSLLMRQQLIGRELTLGAAAQVRSRNASKARMLLDHPDLSARLASIPFADLVVVNTSVLPQESRFGKFMTTMSGIVGHVVSVGFFVVAIIIWLAFGPANQWSNQWQLDINSATSAWMIFIFSLLAIIRERHADFLRASLEAANKVDRAIEERLRSLTSDRHKNPPVLIVPPKTNIVQETINCYANVVGTLAGVAILIVVFIVWLAIGPVMHFNSNWWLLIGTYAGLVGLNDGFVMRNVQEKISRQEKAEFDTIHGEDITISRIAGREPPCKEPRPASVSERASKAIANFCSHEAMVVAGVLLILGLILGASAMHWTLTGQLLCNVPPSILESFFMQILITGHNDADAHRRADFTKIYHARLELLARLHAIDSTHTGPDDRAEKGLGG
jgi:low-affinity ferrous iron transport protein